MGVWPNIIFVLIRKENIVRQGRADINGIASNCPLLGWRLRRQEDDQTSDFLYKENQPQVEAEAEAGVMYDIPAVTPRPSLRLELDTRDLIGETDRGYADE